MLVPQILVGAEPFSRTLEFMAISTIKNGEFCYSDKVETEVRPDSVSPTDGGPSQPVEPLSPVPHLLSARFMLVNCAAYESWRIF